MTRSMGYSILSDEEASTTVETYHRHLPYCHPRLGFSLLDETCRIALNPYTHIQIGSPSRNSPHFALFSHIGFSLWSLGSFLPSLVSIGIDGRDEYWIYFSSVESTPWFILRRLFINALFEVVSAHADPAVKLLWLSKVGLRVQPLSCLYLSLFK